MANTAVRIEECRIYEGDGSLSLNNSSHLRVIGWNEDFDELGFTLQLFEQAGDGEPLTITNQIKLSAEAAKLLGNFIMKLLHKKD